MTSFADDFNRADSSSLGAGWVEVSGDWSIISQQLSSGSAGGTIILRAAGAMATSDNSAQVTIAATAAVSHGVWCRGDNTLTSGYLWRNDGSGWTLFSVVGGSFSSIGSFAGAAVAGDVAKVQAVGTTIRGFVNGVQRVSVSDSNVTSGTSVGIRAESTSSLRFDDFTGADVTNGVTGDAALAGTATLSASGLRAAASGAAQAATAGLSTAGQLGAVGSASEAVTATLTAIGARGAAAAASCAVTAALSAVGSAGLVGGASLVGAVGLSAGGVRGTSAGGTRSAVASLTAAGQVGGALVPGVSGPGVAAAPGASRGAPSAPAASSGRVLVPTASGGSA